MDVFHTISSELRGLLIAQMIAADASSGVKLICVGLRRGVIAMSFDSSRRRVVPFEFNARQAQHIQCPRLMWPRGRNDACSSPISRRHAERAKIRRVQAGRLTVLDASLCSPCPTRTDSIDRTTLTTRQHAPPPRSEIT